jgi:hypothetical protein
MGMNPAITLRSRFLAPGATALVSAGKTQRAWARATSQRLRLTIEPTWQCLPELGAGVAVESCGQWRDFMRSAVYCAAVGIVWAATLFASSPAAAQPAGSYQDSCRNIRTQGDFLPNALVIADCMDARGNWAQSSLQYKSCYGSDIANIDGRLSCAGSGNAGNLPSGSWRDSCRNAYRQGGGLYAQCQAANGQWRDASLDLNRCPRGPVGNDNGQLFCEGAGNAGNLPSGSWRDSCRNGYRQGGDLYAECQAAHGRWRDASLDLNRCPHGPVGNDNGQLFCEGAGNAGNLPGGSWRDSCRNGNRQGAQLYAQCRAANGKWRDASLDLGRCPRGLVGNDNGRLFCEGAGNAGNLPSGRWRDSCRNGYRQGAQLYAECQSANGKWRDASLDLSHCSRGPVGNNNGRLFCAAGGSATSIILYQNKGFSGRAMTFADPIPDLRAYGFANMASSVRTRGVWYVCTKPNYSGECTKTTGDIDLSSKWNDRIASIRPAQ